ncbi:MAG TPA: sodium/proline symporter [Bacteroidales bacterium]|nr:sodium/proline symporter [Bacteroidales bacterium]
MERNVYELLGHPLAMGIFVLTLFLPVIVGLFASRRTKNQADFFVGGRSMNAFVVGLSAVSTGRSAWLVLGLSGVAYTSGVGAVWAIVGYILVEAWQFYYLGRRLRRQSQKFNSITLLDYFTSRFNDRSNLLRITGVFIIGLFITAYVAAQFNAGSKALSTAMNLSVEVSLAIAGLLIMIYMVLGGYVAVAFNDVLRAIIMLVGLVTLPVFLVFQIGGWEVFWDMLQQLSPALVDPWALGLGVIIGFVGIGLGSPGQPQIVVRYMSIAKEENLKYSAILGTFWNLMLGLGAICIGLAGRVLVPDVNQLPGSDPEMIYLAMSAEYFGPAIYGLLLGGVFAAILSTADSQLLVVASTFACDLYEKVMKPKASFSEKERLTISRIVVVLAGIIALVLAYFAQELVFWLVLFAWGGLGAAFGPSLILALFWKKTTKYGVFAGMVTGAVAVIAWRLWLREPTGVYELIPAFLLGWLMVVLVSKATRENPDAVAG